MSDPNWALLDLEGVRDVALQAARRIANRYPDYTDLEDLKQDALTLIVTKRNLQEALLGDEPEFGLLQYRLEQDLVEGIEADVRRRSKQISFDRLEGGTESDPEFAQAAVPLPSLTADYNRDSVEFLLPAVWDESYAYGLPQREGAPDPDMPRGTTNPKLGNNLPAYIADIKTGWAKAPLTLKERRAVLMFYGLSWTHEEIAHHEGIDRSTITHRLFAAVGKIVARLNAGIWYELEGVEA